MASKSEVNRYRKHLQIAAQVVRDSQIADASTIAASLDELRSPHGFERLSVDVPTASSDAVNFSILTPKHLSKQIQDAAVNSVEAPGAKASTVLGGLLEERFRQLLDGELTPAEIPRDARGSSPEKGNMSVPVSNAVLQQVRDALPVLKARLGYTGNPTLPKLALRLLLDEYGLDYEPKRPEFGGLADMHLYVSPRLAAGIQEKLADIGEDMRRLIREGFTKAVAGEWEPFDVPKAPHGSDPERVRLITGTDPGLTEQLRARIPEMSRRLGYRVSPATTAIAYLVEELGLDDVFAAEYGVTTD